MAGTRRGGSKDRMGNPQEMAEHTSASVLTRGVYAPTAARYPLMALGLQRGIGRVYGSLGREEASCGHSNKKPSTPVRVLCPKGA